MMEEWMEIFPHSDKEQCRQIIREYVGEYMVDKELKMNNSNIKPRIEISFKSGN